MFTQLFACLPNATPCCCNKSRHSHISKLHTGLIFTSAAAPIDDLAAHHRTGIGLAGAGLFGVHDMRPLVRWSLRQKARLDPEVPAIVHQKRGVKYFEQGPFDFPMFLVVVNFQLLVFKDYFQPENKLALLRFYVPVADVDPVVSSVLFLLNRMNSTFRAASDSDFGFICEITVAHERLLLVLRRHLLRPRNV